MKETTLWGELAPGGRFITLGGVNIALSKSSANALSPSAAPTTPISLWGFHTLYTNVFGMPVRRPAALVGAAALVATGVLVAAAPAHATGSSAEGSASAVTARVGLDLNLLTKADIPVDLTLNEVRAPRTSEKTLLSTRITGVEKGQPVEIVRADIAKSRAVTEGNKNEGYANLVDVQVNVPGLPDKPLFEAQQVTSKATCIQGQQPTANSELLGHITVLGQRVNMSASGSATVDAPGLGRVQLDLSKESTTSTSAAATALKLNVKVKPAKLNVAAVSGQVVLVEAKCTAGGDGSTASGGATGGEDAGQTGGSGDSGGSAGSAGSGGSGDNAGSTEGAATSGDTAGTEGSGGNQPGTQTGDDGKNLAETGGGSTLALGGVGAALLLGGGALVYMRRRKASAES